MALLLLAGGLIVLALGIGCVGRRRARSARGAPLLALSTSVIEADGFSRGTVNLTGRLMNPANLRAPLSGRPCLAWEVVLCQEKRYEEEAEPSYTPLWADGRSGDLVVGYDVRRSSTADGHRRHASADRCVIAVPGQVRIPAAKMRFRSPRRDGVHPVLARPLPEPLHPAQPALLDQLGVPAALAEAVRAQPSRFRFAEATLTTGDYFRAYQGPVPQPRWLPDPEAAYQIMPTGQPDAPYAAGCLVVLLLLAAAVSAATGVAALR